MENENCTCIACLIFASNPSAEARYLCIMDALGQICDEADKIPEVVSLIESLGRQRDFPLRADTTRQEFAYCALLVAAGWAVCAHPLLRPRQRFREQYLISTFALVPWNFEIAEEDWLMLVWLVSEQARAAYSGAALFNVSPNLDRLAKNAISGSAPPDPAKLQVVEGTDTR